MPDNEPDVAAIPPSASKFYKDYKPPFPWFGGKSHVANLVWERFGDVNNFVEPFFGSGAVMFLRPHEPKIETINDKDCFVANFFRSIKKNPDAVAEFADNPVNEADLLARHKWLIEQGQGCFTENMRTDPEYFDPKIAGWWVWGICCWIGDGWCKSESQKLPHLGDAGQGINRKLPPLSEGGHGIANYLNTLAIRLRDVRVACGDWKRVTGSSVTLKHGITGVFLDPPYSLDERSEVYSVDENVGREVCDWAIEIGNNKLLRIAICGYEGEHEMPPTWKKVFWKTNGGFSNQSAASASRGKRNKYRETIWFSPYCLNEKQKNLFETA